MVAAESVIAETKAKLEMSLAKRTNRDSLCQDVWAKNPKIKEEVCSGLGAYIHSYTHGNLAPFLLVPFSLLTYYPLFCCYLPICYTKCYIYANVYTSQVMKEIENHEWFKDIK